MANDIVSTEWECEKCKNSFNITGMQRLRHIMGKAFDWWRANEHQFFKKKLFPECKKIHDAEEQSTSKNSNETNEIEAKPGKSNSKKFICDVCNKKMYLTSIEILKHKKTCK